MATEYPRESLEYIFFDISVERGDVTGATVYAAFFSAPNQRPIATDWIQGTLVAPTDPMGIPGKHSIRILIGPTIAAEWNHGGTADDYQPWTRIASNPEDVVRMVAKTVTIT